MCSVSPATNSSCTSILIHAHARARTASTSPSQHPSTRSAPCLSSWKRCLLLSRRSLSRHFRRSSCPSPSLLTRSSLQVKKGFAEFHDSLPGDAGLLLSLLCSASHIFKTAVTFHLNFTTTMLSRCLRAKHARCSDPTMRLIHRRHRQLLDRSRQEDSYCPLRKVITSTSIFPSDTRLLSLPCHPLCRISAFLLSALPVFSHALHPQIRQLENLLGADGRALSNAWKGITYVGCTNGQSGGRAGARGGQGPHAARRKCNRPPTPPPSHYLHIQMTKPISLYAFGLTLLAAAEAGSDSGPEKAVRCPRPPYFLI
jgi:hypothetical protein